MCSSQRQVPALAALLSEPQAVASRDELGCSSWLEYFQGVVTLLDAIEKQGLRPGDHAAVLMSNRRQYFEVYLAAVFAGIWLTPINSHLTQPEIDYVLVDCGAKLLLLDADNADVVHAELPCLQVDSLAVVQMTAQRVYQRLQGLLAQTPGGVMMYTSGTTGKPKGVQRAVMETVESTLLAWSDLARGLGLDGKGVHMVTGPAYHAAPGLYALYDLLNGASLLIMPRWDAQQCLDWIARYQVTHTHLVPTMFVRLLRAREGGARDSDTSSLTLVLHGAAPVSPAVKRDMIAWWGPVIEEYWGGSESGIITRVNTKDWLSNPGTVGKPLPQFEVKVVDEQGQSLPSGEIGHLYARRCGVAQPFRYFNDAEKTADSYLDDWFTLGDLGWLDQAGYVYLADRRSNLIISGGVNIYPAEIEALLTAHPQVVDVVVVGVPDEEWGKRVHAIVQPLTGVDLEALEQSLRDELAQQLASFKCPRSYEFTAALPRFDSGKLYKQRL